MHLYSILQDNPLEVLQEPVTVERKIFHTFLDQSILCHLLDAVIDIGHQRPFLRVEGSFG